MATETLTRPKTKEPWQMTKAEWETARENLRPEIRQVRFTRKSGSEEVARFKAIDRLNYGVQKPIDVELMGRPAVIHKDVIGKALSEGKAVPVEVLKDYPELGKKAEATEVHGGTSQEKPKAVVKSKRNYGKDRSVYIVEYEYDGHRYITGTVIRGTEKSQNWYFGKGVDGVKEANRIALLSDEEFSKIEDDSAYSWTRKRAELEGKAPQAKAEPTIKQATNWQRAQTEASEQIEAIENEWVAKSHVGTTKEQQGRVDATIVEVAKKHHVPASTLRKAVLWEAPPTQLEHPKRMTADEVEEWFKSQPESAKSKVAEAEKARETSHREYKPHYNPVARAGERWKLRNYYGDFVKDANGLELRFRSQDQAESYLKRKAKPEAPAKPETSTLDKPITAHRGNIRAWFREPSNWASKERLTYRQVVEQVAKDRDITFKKVEVPIDPSKPLGDTKAIYQVELDGKKLREFPKEVYDYHQSLKGKPEAEAVLEPKKEEAREVGHPTLDKYRALAERYPEKIGSYIERAKSEKASIVLGREFGESTESYFSRNPSVKKRWDDCTKAIEEMERQPAKPKAEVPAKADITETAKAMGLSEPQIAQAKKEGVTTALGLRRIEKNARKEARIKEIGILQPKPGAKQSDRAIAIDRSLLAKQVVAVDDPRWLKRPNRFDVRGVDTPGSHRIIPGVAYTDKGAKRLARRHHKGWRRVKFT